MRVIRHVALGLCTVWLMSGCGTKSAEPEQSIEQKPAAPELSSSEKAELESEFAKIPSSTIVRVPVDAEGNPIGEPEMRVVQDAQTALTDEGVSLAFAGGNAPQAMVNSASELDADSSTQSWRSWGYGSCHYTSYSRCGYSSYGYNYFYNQYRPTLYTRGYRWNYQPSYYCQRGGYSYYSYSAYRSW